MPQIYKREYKWFFSYWKTKEKNTMACDTTLYFTIIFSIFFIIPIIESSRCSKNYTFQGWQLNSSIPFDLNLSSNDSNDTINQNCLVKLSIDFTAGLVNGSFTAENQSYGHRKST